MVNEDGAILITAKHSALCDRRFTSSRGIQNGIIGTLRCACGKLQAYLVPLKDEVCQ